MKGLEFQGPEISVDSAVQLFHFPPNPPEQRVAPVGTVGAAGAWRSERSVWAWVSCSLVAQFPCALPRKHSVK